MRARVSFDEGPALESGSFTFMDAFNLSTPKEMGQCGKLTILKREKC